MGKGIEHQWFCIYISISIFSYYTSNPKAVVCFTFHLPLGVLTRQLLQRRLQKHLVSKPNNMGRVFGCSFPRGVWKHLHPVQGKKSMVLNKSVKEACMSFVAMTRYWYMIIYIYMYTQKIRNMDTIWSLCFPREKKTWPCLLRTSPVLPMRHGEMLEETVNSFVFCGLFQLWQSMSLGNYVFFPFLFHEQPFW